MNGLLKNLGYNTVGMVLYNMAIWLFSAFILRILGETMSGYYAVAVSIGNTLYAVGLWGIRSYLVSDVEYKFSYSDYCIARGMAIISSCLLLAVVCVVFHYNLEQTLVLILYSLFKFAETLIELIDCFCQRALQMDINAKSMIIRSLLLTSGFGICLWVTKSLIAGLALITLVTIGVFYFYNYQKAKKLFDLKLGKEFIHSFGILKNCLPIMIFELLASAIVAIPRLFYERIGSIETLGVYTSVYSLVIFLQLVVNVLIFTLAPYMAKAYKEKQNKEFIKYALTLFLGATGLALCAEGATFLLGNFVIGLLYGAKHASSYTYLFLGIVSGLTLTYTWMVSQIFVIQGKSSYQLVCAIVSVVCCCLLSMFLIDGKSCNLISIVLVLTNLSYLATAGLILIFSRNKLVNE